MLNSNNLGVQLWSLRDALAKNAKTTIDQLAELNIQLIETSDLIQLNDLSALLRSNDISVRSSFIQWSFVSGRWDLYPYANMYPNKDIRSQFELAQKHGLSYLVNGYLLPEERRTFNDFQVFTDKLQNAAEQAKEYGLRMAYHNHGFEFELQNKVGTTAFQYLLSNTDDVFFELDLMWAHVAQQNITVLITEIGNRLTLLHLKDSSFQHRPLFNDQTKPPESFCAIGTGEVPILQAVKQAKHVDYYFIEQDYSQDIFKDIRTSQKFLLSNV